MFGVWGEGGIEHTVVQAAVFLRTMIIIVDKVFNIVVRPDVANVLGRDNRLRMIAQWQPRSDWSEVGSVHQTMASARDASETIPLIPLFLKQQSRMKNYTFPM